MLPSPSVEHLLHCLNRCLDVENVACSINLYSYSQRMNLETHACLAAKWVYIFVKAVSICSLQQVFNRLVLGSAGLWNALISRLLKLGHSSQAFTMYQKMQEHAFVGDGQVYVALLGACSQLKLLELGLKLHCDIARLGMLEENLFVGNTLIDMYVKCHSLDKAKEVFDMLFMRDAVSWNVLISGYALYDLGEEALICLEHMRRHQYSPNAVTLASCLKACGSIRAANMGMVLHAEALKKGVDGGDIVLGSSLVDMYARCGLLENAQHIFNTLSERDVVLWTTLISGYVQHEQAEKALDCFEKMHDDGVLPNAMTLVSGLKACSNIGAPDKGRMMHAEAARTGCVINDPVLATSLLDMYAKCGLLGRAVDVFKTISPQDIVSWNSMVSGYAQLGDAGDVFSVCEAMRNNGVGVDSITFISLLNTCSHAGLVEIGHACFEAMGKQYGIAPNLEHHLCLLDLLGRAGQLDAALSMIDNAPVHPSKSMWRTVVGACQKWGNAEIGEEAFEQALQLGEKQSGIYICMLNLYTDLSGEDKQG